MQLLSQPNLGCAGGGHGLQRARAAAGLRRGAAGGACGGVRPPHAAALLATRHQRTGVRHTDSRNATALRAAATEGVLQSSNTTTEAPEASTTASPVSSCPFLSTTASASAAGFAPGQQQQLPLELASLQGPGGIWRVLPDASTSSSSSGSDSTAQQQQMPPAPEGRWCWNPLLGEYGEMERKGMGPFLVERYKQYGPVFTWQLGPTKVVAVLDNVAIKTLLKQGDSKVIVAWNPESMYAMLGEGARRSLEDPNFRKSSRKHLSPGFSREALRGYMSKLVDICSSQLDEWSAAGAGPIDMAAEGKNLSFEFSTQLLVDFKIPPERKAELKSKFNKLFTGMTAPPIKLPGTRFSQGLQARAELLEEIRVLMEQRQPGPRKSVLDYNLAAKTEYAKGAGRALTPVEIAEAGIGLIIAGNDTSGLGVTALLAVLPLFPEVLHELRAEQQRLIELHGPELTVSLLDDMNYAEAVVKEVLRVAPPSGLVMRRTLVDMEICGKFIPAGSILHLSTFMGQVLTDPRLDVASYSEADLRALYDNWALITQHTLSADFDPDRWLRETATAVDGAAVDVEAATAAAANSSSSSSDTNAVGHPSGLLTFSVGPHACLGYSLFMAEAKVLLALLARGYTAQPVAPESLNFKANFLTLLRKGSVSFGRQEQPLPVKVTEHRPRSVALAAAAAAAAGGDAAAATDAAAEKEPVAA